MNKKTEVKPIVLIIFLVITFLLSISFVSPLDSLGIYKQGETVRVVQVCSDATYINISSIAYPNSSVAISNVGMTSAGSGEFYYDFTTSVSGRYDVRGISDGCEGTFATYFVVTSTGEDYNESQFGIIITWGIMILLFGGLGFSFSKDKWKLRGFFFVLAMFIGVLMLNSIRVLAGMSTTLDTMITSGMIIGIIAVSFMAVYLLIMYTIELFKTIKNKRSMRWEVSDRFS
jgi:phosphatidylserine synthase